MLVEVSHHTIDDALLPAAPVVLDVGSRNYGFSNGILAIRPQAKIIALEPDPAVPEPGFDLYEVVPRPDVIQARQLAWERTAQAVAAEEAAAEIRSRLASAPRRERAAMAAEAARLDRAAEKAHRMARPWMRIATM